MYKPYRGRKSGGSPLRTVLLIVLAIVVLLAVLYYFFGSNFIRYRDDGSMYLSFPWSSTQKTAAAGDTSAAGDAGEKVPLTIDKQDDASSAVRKCVEAPAAKLGDAAYVEQLKALYTAGTIDAVSIEVKAADGSLAYPFVSATAQKTPVVPNVSAGVKTAVQTLQSAGVPLVAVLNVFNDNQYARLNPGTALTDRATGGIWQDASGRAYLNPVSDLALQYIHSLVAELCTVGFQEIQLRGFLYPGTGNTGNIVYGDTAADGAKRRQMLDKRLSELVSAAGDVQISVYLVNPNDNNGLNDVTGMDFPQFYAAAAHVYVPLGTESETSGDSLKTVLGQLTGGDSTKVVPMYKNVALCKTRMLAGRSAYLLPDQTGGAVNGLMG